MTGISNEVRALTNLTRKWQQQLLTMGGILGLPGELGLPSYGTLS
jgi:hypothetical protein